MTKQRFFQEDPDYIPKIYGYSQRRIEDDDETIKTREECVRAYIAMRELCGDSTLAGAQWDGMHQEPRSAKALQNTFRMRPVGKKLVRILRPGDHLIVDKLTSLTKSHEDLRLTNRFLAEYRISLHIVSIDGQSLDSGCDIGRIMVDLLATSQKMADVLRQESMSESKNILIAKHKWPGGRVPFFCTVNGAPSKIGGTKWLEIKPNLMPVMEQMHKSIKAGTPYHEAITWAETELGSIYDRAKVRYLYSFYIGWLAVGKPDINTINIRDTARVQGCTAESGSSEDPGITG